MLGTNLFPVPPQQKSQVSKSFPRGVLPRRFLREQVANNRELCYAQKVQLRTV